MTGGVRARPERDGARVRRAIPAAVAVCGAAVSGASLPGGLDWSPAGHAEVVAGMPAAAAGEAQPGHGDGAANVAYDGRFTFVRLRYPMASLEGGFSFFGRGRRGPPWAHDYPRAERNLVRILSEITFLNPYLDGSNILSLDDPELYKYPVAYMSEPGYWTLTDAESAALRAYLLKGGFLIFDDFRGRHWINFEAQLARVLPDYRLIQLDASHPIFHSFFEIESLDFVQFYDRAGLLRRVRGQRSVQAVVRDRQLQQRHRRVLGVLGHGLRAHRSVQRSLQVGYQLHRLRHDALNVARGQKGSRTRMDMTRDDEVALTFGETEPTDLDQPDDVALADRLKAGRDRIAAELGKAIIGQDDVVGEVLLTLFVGGNSLIVGVPGLAKTLIVRTMADVLDLKFSRIQFTPDLMPSDITGTDIIQDDPATGQRKMVFAPGPVFTNILLADEINRTPPKTQSALLEAMQEHRVTIQGRTYDLEEPFFVFATQNPIELEGTYPLPEAQLDRFMFHIIIDHPPESEELEVVRSTTALQEHQFEPTVTGADLVTFQRLVRKVPVSEPVMRYALSLARMSRRRNREDAPEFVKKWVAFGASVRAAQYLVLGGKARALANGRYHVTFEDIRALAHPVLRHRILTNFHAESEGVTSDQLIDQLLEVVPVPRSGL